MNRIRELRKEKKLSTYALADLVGTTQPTIHRLETGKRKLTVDWMKRIAEALGVAPEELIAPTLLPDAGNDVSPHHPDDLIMRQALAGSTRQLWRVDEPTLDYLGIKPGEIHVVDTSIQKISCLLTGNLVLIKVYDIRDMKHPRTLLRQFVAPSMFITNSSKNNARPIDAKRVDVTVVGVLLPQLN